MRVVSVVLALAVSLVFIGTLSAADQKGPTAKAEHQGNGPWGMFKGLNLTDAQKAKVEELRKGYEPKFKAALDSVLTADQKKARDAAVKAAKDAGKKGPRVFEAARAAVKLTDAQKAKMKEAVKPLAKEFREKVKAILTPAQQEQLKTQIAKAEHHGDGPWGMLMGLSLTDAQKAKIKELGKGYEPKFKAAADGVLTADQKKARDAAVKAAKDAGTKGPEVFAAARAAVKLTDAQKAKMKEAITPLAKEFREKVKAILTPAQQEQLKTQIAKHAPGGRGPQGGPSPQCHSSQSKGGPCALGKGVSCPGGKDGKWQGHHKCGHCGHHKHGHHHGCHHGHHGHHSHHHGCHHGHHGHHGHHHGCHHGHHHCHHGHHHCHHGHHHCHHGHHHCHHGHHGKMTKGQHGSCPSKCPSGATCPAAKKPTAKCPSAATGPAAKALTGTKAIEAKLVALEREKTATVAALKKAEEATKARLIALDKQRQEALSNLEKAKKAEKEPTGKKEGLARH